jgi:regulator of extracellular matrix RemA (YlzA/DUF370 family)
MDSDHVVLSAYSTEKLVSKLSDDQSDDKESDENV